MSSSRKFTMRLNENDIDSESLLVKVKATTRWKTIYQAYADATNRPIDCLTFHYDSVRIGKHNSNKTVGNSIDDVELYDEDDMICNVCVTYNPKVILCIGTGDDAVRIKVKLTTTKWLKTYEAYHDIREKDFVITNLAYKLWYDDCFINPIANDGKLTVADVISKAYKMDDEIQIDVVESVDKEEEPQEDIKMEDIMENNKCLVMDNATQILTNYLKIPSEFIDSSKNFCYCEKCHTTRGDNEYYPRGKPSKKYVLPIGWSRIGLNVYAPKCKINNVWNDWHVAYHGCSIETAKNIFKSGLVLLKPGDSTINGEELKIKPGHIKGEVQRYNEYTMKNELFDPNQIFVTPSIRYASNEIYAKPFSIHDGCQKLKAQCVFQLRIRPGCYNIGQETIGATTAGTIIDKHIPNKELEWYTKEFLGIIIYGLLIRYWK
eukprot:41095_1